jgi:hypothetical protein
MGNTPKIKRSQPRAKKASRPATTATATASRPWKKYVLGGGALLLGVFAIALIASDVTSNPQGIAEPPEGSEFFDVPVADHVIGQVQYEQDPPVGGPHGEGTAACQAYDVPVVNENAVHALEHGAVWITYQPDLDPDDINTLEGFVSRREVLVSPYPGLDSPIVASTWGRQLRVDSADDARIDQFIRAFQNQTAPENAAAC